MKRYEKELKTNTTQVEKMAALNVSCTVSTLYNTVYTAVGNNWNNVSSSLMYTHSQRTFEC